MADFDRFDICAAHAALETDWHTGGMLRGGFASLENDNQREIYCDAMQAFGLRPSQDDPITLWLKGQTK